MIILKQIRYGTFETNSSSTHTLVIPSGVADLKKKNKDLRNYLPAAKHAKIEWICTDDYYTLTTFEEKLSYLVSQIALPLTYSCNNYKELLEELQDNFEYQLLAEYIKTKFDKEIRFPDNENGVLDNMNSIIEINHQLISGSHFMAAEETLNDLIEYCQNKPDPDYSIYDYNNPEVRPKGLFNEIKKVFDIHEENDEALTFEQKLDIYFDKDTYIIFGRD